MSHNIIIKKNNMCPPFYVTNIQPTVVIASYHALVFYVIIQITAFFLVNNTLCAN